MPFFVIVGKQDCPNFVQVAHAARHLTKRLPQFHIQIIQKKPIQWERWLEKIMNEYEWTITQSPVVYRELIYRGGRPHLIGSISDFWQYCYDYYNFELLLTQPEVLNLVKDNIKYFPDLETDGTDVKHVCIFGIASPMLSLLLLELEKIRCEYLGETIKIKLFDVNMDYATIHEYSEQTVNELNDNMGLGIEIAEAPDEALKNCLLVIIIDDLLQKPNEMTHQWRLRNIVYMHIIADYINQHGNRNLRIILGHYGSVCFNATLLMEAATSIEPRNVVAVTSDLGLPYVSAVSKRANIPVANLGAPIVWGCVGLNEYVDVGSIIKRCDMLLPNARAIKTNGGSTLPLGSIKTELRFINYIVDDNDQIRSDIDGFKERIRKSDRRPIFSKVRSIISLIKIWYRKPPSDAIISLGTCSNGSFNIMPNLVFSQPAILRDGSWTPYAEFPLTESTKTKVKELSDEAEAFMNTYLVKKLPTEKDYVYI